MTIEERILRYIHKLPESKKAWNSDIRIEKNKKYLEKLCDVSIWSCNLKVVQKGL
jgi:hypothetical protein